MEGVDEAVGLVMAVSNGCRGTVTMEGVNGKNRTYDDLRFTYEAYPSRERNPFNKAYEE